MRLIFITLLFTLPVLSWAQDSYDKAAITQWLQNGAWDEVINTAQHAEHPDSFLLQSAGYASYQAGDKAASQQYFEQLLANDSNNKLALYYCGLMQKAEEAYKAATPLLERLCRLVPQVAQYHVMLAECYSATDKRPEAVKQLQMARNLSPLSASIANKLALAFSKMPVWDSAQQVLYNAMRQHPGDPMLIGSAITISYNRKQYVRTSSWTDSLIATGRMKYELLLTGLYADIELKNYAHAVRVGNIVMAMGMQTEDVLYYTALAHQQMGEWKAADTLLQKCIAKVLKPNLEAYYIALGEGAAKQQQWARSKACFDTAYYLFKKPLTLYRKGYTLETAGKGSEASAAYRKYLALPASVQDTNISKYLRHYVGD